jgi:hypothetical protein
LASHDQQQQQQQQSSHPFASLKPLVDSLVHFLKKSGIDLELSKSLNVRLLDNVILLARVQKLLLQDRDIRDLVAAAAAPAVGTVAGVAVVPSNEEALRYMKYATAAYGDSMIRAANLDVKGDLSFFGIQNKKLTKTRVSEHINVPERDIIAMDVEYGGDSNHLRHFVAVDHAHQKIVLAIRGTFTISELVVDAAGFSSKRRNGTIIEGGGGDCCCNASTNAFVHASFSRSSPCFSLNSLVCDRSFFSTWYQDRFVAVTLIPKWPTWPNEFGKWRVQSLKS